MNSIKAIFKIAALGLVLVLLSGWSRIFGEKQHSLQSGIGGLFDTDEANADLGGGPGDGSDGSDGSDGGDS